MLNLKNQLLPFARNVLCFEFLMAAAAFEALEISMSEFFLEKTLKFAIKLKCKCKCEEERNCVTESNP